MKNTFIGILATALIFTSGGLYAFATGKIERNQCNYLDAMKH
jgi:hypothetical protein